MGIKAERAQATRERLVGAARALFVERGYERSPLEEILRAASVSKGALYHHFANKEALFEAVFERVEGEVTERIIAAAAGATDPLAMLRTASDCWLDLIAKDPKVRQITLVDGPAVLGWRRWREIEEHYGFGLAKLALQSAMDAGVIATQSVEMLAHVLLAVLGEVAMVVARSPNPARARAEGQAILDRFLDSLAPA